MFFSFVFSHVWYSPGPLVPRTVLCPFYMIFRYLFIEWEQNTFLLKGVSGKTDMALTIEVSRPLSTQNSKVLPLIQPLISFPRRAGQPSYEAVRGNFSFGLVTSIWRRFLSPAPCRHCPRKSQATSDLVCVTQCSYGEDTRNKIQKEQEMLAF